MKIIFKEGTENMEYQKFVVSSSALRVLKGNDLVREMMNELYDMIIKAFLHNRIYGKEKPYRFEGFHCLYGREVNDKDNIVFYFRPSAKVTKIFHGEWLSIDFHNDTFSIFAELNWELK